MSDLVTTGALASLVFHDPQKCDLRIVLRKSGVGVQRVDGRGHARVLYYNCKNDGRAMTFSLMNGVRTIGPRLLHVPRISWNKRGQRRRVIVRNKCSEYAAQT